MYIVETIWVFANSDDVSYVLWDTR